MAEKEKATCSSHADKTAIDIFEAPSQKKHWTTADYTTVEPKWREGMKKSMEDYATSELIGNESTGTFLSFAKYVSLLQRASEHPSLAVGMNMCVLHGAVFMARETLDDRKTQGNGEPDPEVDNEAVRPAKFRFIDFLEKEAERLGIKDMENLVLYMSEILTAMGEFYFFMRLIGGFKEIRRPRPR